MRWINGTKITRSNCSTPNSIIWFAKQNLRSDVEHLCFHDDKNELRALGIELQYEAHSRITLPLKFSFNQDAVYDELTESVSCPHKGFFY
ncbi:hypothetical protein VAZ01S_023_00230 [Vibrio azureus NBRC 104587]|uniref:Uncharacterized protein n=1 Tax=Vibrio azureus NBRC 104587 TaxID=1219077 RepID=U3A5I1_9VIBR|nr:hypothetical protein VAZ01S_023_00230 [Vibrio azureus NBRC 104587]